MRSSLTEAGGESSIVGNVRSKNGVGAELEKLEPLTYVTRVIRTRL